MTFFPVAPTVDPREYPGTCEHCGLHSLCRVQERDNFAMTAKTTHRRGDRR